MHQSHVFTSGSQCEPLRNTLSILVLSCPRRAHVPFVLQAMFTLRGSYPSSKNNPKQFELLKLPALPMAIPVSVPMASSSSSSQFYNESAMLFITVRLFCNIVGSTSLDKTIISVKQVRALAGDQLNQMRDSITINRKIITFPLKPGTQHTNHEKLSKTLYIFLPYLRS